MREVYKRINGLPYARCVQGNCSGGAGFLGLNRSQRALCDNRIVLSDFEK